MSAYENGTFEAVGSGDEPPWNVIDGHVKLVRDKINCAATRPVESNGEHEKLLREKILEEAFELHEADTREKILEEAADILEVVYAIMWNNEIDLWELQNARMAKLDRLGGFTGGNVLDTRE